jgi:hypothetical protein
MPTNELFNFTLLAFSYFKKSQNWLCVNRMIKGLNILCEAHSFTFEHSLSLSICRRLSNTFYNGFTKRATDYASTSAAVAKQIKG